VFNIKSDQTNGNNGVFIDKSDDSGVCQLVGVSKQPKFNVSPSESSQTCQEFEALQLLLMVMSSSHNLVKISKLNWIHIFMHNSLLNIHPLVMSSFLKGS